MIYIWFELLLFIHPQKKTGTLKRLHNSTSRQYVTFHGRHSSALRSTDAFRSGLHFKICVTCNFKLLPPSCPKQKFGMSRMRSSIYSCNNPSKIWLSSKLHFQSASAPEFTYLQILQIFKAG